jgi:hypothetical protein
MAMPDGIHHDSDQFITAVIGSDGERSDRGRTQHRLDNLCRWEQTRVDGTRCNNKSSGIQSITILVQVFSEG